MFSLHQQFSCGQPSDPNSVFVGLGSHLIFPSVSDNLFKKSQTQNFNFHQPNENSKNLNQTIENNMMFQEPLNSNSKSNEIKGESIHEQVFKMINSPYERFNLPNLDSNKPKINFFTSLPPFLDSSISKSYQFGFKNSVWKKLSV